MRAPSRRPRLTQLPRLVVVASLVGALLAGCGDDQADSADSADTTTAVEQTSPSSTEPSTTSTGSSTTESPTSEPSTSSTTGGAGADAICSADGLDRPGPQSSLPEAVALQREAILDAALACDIDALAALTGPDFTASFGGDAPADLWRLEEEELGADPLRSLVELLRLPSYTSGSGGGAVYIWPTAFSYDTWDEVPEAQRQELSELYGEEDFAGFDSFGGYIGYRTGIDAAGTWTFFVAGD